MPIYRRAKCPNIYDLIQLFYSRRWRKATNWLRKYPNSVSEFKSSNGWTILHLVCSFDPPEYVIEAILKIDLKAVTKPDDKGYLPLHIAVCSSSQKVISILLRVDPSSVHVKTFDGLYTPLSLLCLKYEKQLVETIRRPLLHKSQLEGTVMLLMRKLEPLIKASYYKVSGVGMTSCDPLVGMRKWKDAEDICSLVEECTDRYHKTTQRNLVAALVNREMITKRAANIYTLRTRSQRQLKDTKFRLVHACSGIKDCPSTLMSFALKVYPNQVTEPDEEGNLPLHIAAACIKDIPAETNFQAVVAYIDRCASDIREHSTDDTEYILANDLPSSLIPLSGVQQDTVNLSQISSVQERKSPIELLLTACPSSAKVYNSQHKLPVHVALESGRSWEDGVCSLHKANMLSLVQREDSVLKRLLRGCHGDRPEPIIATDSHLKNSDLDLFPFMYAACHGSCLTTVYMLFRACPEVPRFCKLEGYSDPLHSDSDCHDSEISDINGGRALAIPLSSTQKAKVVSWSPLPCIIYDDSKFVDQIAYFHMDGKENASLRKDNFPTAHQTDATEIKRKRKNCTASSSKRKHIKRI